jgi:hypothetical protein
VYRKHGGQRGYKGHVLNLPQDIQSFLNRLPSRVADLPVLIVRRHGAEDTHRDFTVCRHKVLEAVLWLKTNNPFFKNIEIDRDVIQRLPENGIPDELRYVIDKNELSVHVENEWPPQDPVMSANASVEELVLGSGSTSFIPMRQRQRKEGAAIQDAVNEVDPLDWPSTEGICCQKQPKINRWCVRNLKSTRARVTNKSSSVSQVIVRLFMRFICGFVSAMCALVC